MALALTETAVKQVKQLMEAQSLGSVYLRVGVKGGGCSGLSYQLEFDNEIGPHDKKFDIDGVQVVCDKKSYLYLNGITLDYVTQGLQGGFTFVGASFPDQLVPLARSGSGQIAILVASPGQETWLWRFDENGCCGEPLFVLDRPGMAGRAILLVGEHFGGGQ